MSGIPVVLRLLSDSAVTADMLPEYAVPSSATAAGDPLLEEELVLDVVQILIDLAGIIDPMPEWDIASLCISVHKGDWLGAAVSGIAIVPYVGDVAKLGKLPHWTEVVARVIKYADETPLFAGKIRKPFITLFERLCLFPEGLFPELDNLRGLVQGFLEKTGGIPAVLIPDVSHTYVHLPSEVERAEGVIKRASGRLGIPGLIHTARNVKIQRWLSSRVGDDAGHLIAKMFGAIGKLENLSLQNWISNRFGAWRALERLWAEELGKGHGVWVSIKDYCRPGETRPYKRVVEWTIMDLDGKWGQVQVGLFGNFTSVRCRDAISRATLVIDVLPEAADEFKLIVEQLPEWADQTVFKVLDDVRDYVNLATGEALDKVWTFDDE